MSITILGDLTLTMRALCDFLEEHIGATGRAQRRKAPQGTQEDIYVNSMMLNGTRSGGQLNIFYNLDKNIIAWRWTWGNKGYQSKDIYIDDFDPEELLRDYQLYQDIVAGRRWP
jgi:hypothetical protein